MRTPTAPEALRKRIVQIIAAALFMWWFYHGFTQLLDYTATRVQLAGAGFSPATAAMLAWIIPVTELLVAVPLLFKHLHLAGFYASVALLSMSLIYVLSVTGGRADKINCACSGLTEHMTNGTLLLLNLLLMVLPVAGIWLKTNKYLRSAYA